MVKAQFCISRIPQGLKGLEITVQRGCGAKLRGLLVVSPQEEQNFQPGQKRYVMQRLAELLDWCTKNIGDRFVIPDFKCYPNSAEIEII